MSECPNCQTPYAPGDRFCNQCGQRLLEPEAAPGGGHTQRSLSLADVHYNLGLVYFKKEEYRKALEAWERGLRQDPDNAFLKERVAEVKALLASG